MNPLTKKIELLKELSEQKKEADELVNKMATDIEFLRGEILAEMRENQMQNVRTDSATVTLAQKKFVKIVDEQKVVASLKANKMTDYVQERVNDIFKSAIRSNTDWEGIEGLETTTRDILSIRLKKEANNG